MGVGGARPASRLALRGALAAAALHVGACASGGARDAVGPDYRTAVETEVEHEPCDTAGPDTEKLDADLDGRADIVVVRVGGVERCRSVDLNLDGVVDTWVYRAADGKVRRRESDFDRDGRIDEIAVYQGGVLSEQHRATTLRGRLDTWHVFKQGALAATRRDADGDGYLDQWWEYPQPGRLDCPLIHSDVDGDGRPDPGATVDICQNSGESASPSGVRPSRPVSEAQAPATSPGPAGDASRGASQ